MAGHRAPEDLRRVPNKPLIADFGAEVAALGLDFRKMIMISLALEQLSGNGQPEELMVP
jgi:hypothetical protein